MYWKICVKERAISIQATIHIYIVERNEILRKGLVALLSAEKGIAVVGDSPPGSGVQERIKKGKPDILLYDLNPKEEKELHTLHDVCEINPDVKCIIFTDWDEYHQNSMFEAIKAGAHGYLLKTISYEHFLNGIKATYHDSTYLSPKVTGKLMEKIRDLNGNHHDETGLTLREKEIVLFIARGLSNKQIAYDLNLSIKTVKTHVTHVMEKLHAGNRTDAVIISLKKRLIDVIEI